MPQRVRKQDTRGPERSSYSGLRNGTHTFPTPRQGSPACTPGLQGGNREAGLLPSLLLLLLDFCLLPLLRTPLQQDVSQLRRHEVGSLLRAVIPFQVLTWAPPRNRQGKTGWVVRKGRGKGRQERTGKPAGMEERKRKEKTKTDRLRDQS